MGLALCLCKHTDDYAVKGALLQPHSANIIFYCVPFSPPSTAMTVGIPQTEAECLLEERKGGDKPISHSLTGMFIQTVRLNSFLLLAKATFQF